MNNARRVRLAKIVEQIDGIRADVEELRDAEEEAFDGLPESIQAGERGDRMQDAIGALEEALSSLEDAQDVINRACE